MIPAITACHFRGVYNHAKRCMYGTIHGYGAGRNRWQIQTRPRNGVHKLIYHKTYHNKLYHCKWLSSIYRYEQNGIFCFYQSLHTVSLENHLSIQPIVVPIKNGTVGEVLTSCRGQFIRLRKNGQNLAAANGMAVIFQSIDDNLYSSTHCRSIFSQNLSVRITISGSPL